MQASLEALVEPTRREILRLVWSQELPASNIAEHFPVTRPAISKHLTVLKRAGLVIERRRGTQRLYQADQQAVQNLRAMLESFWDRGLDEVKIAAESATRSRRRSSRLR
jgi:DNA-binding transcriptional ArsR family regulator